MYAHTLNRVLICAPNFVELIKFTVCVVHKYNVPGSPIVEPFGGALQRQFQVISKEQG